ncbi:MAG: hypothetical protein ACRDH5_15275, partial [bacterium]
MEFPPVDFVSFHRDRVPELLAAHGGLAGPDVARVDPLALRVGEDAFTYVPAGGTVEVVEGDEGAATVAVMAPDVWSEFAHELRSCFGLMIGEVVSFDRGDFGGLARWEPALRAVWHGRPIYDEAAAQALDGLDLTQAFTLDDESGIREFLGRAGFVRVRGIFTEAEMLALGEEVERLKAEATFD